MSDASVNEATPPKFTQLLRDLNVQSGHRVCLQCRVTGHPIPDIQWFKDGKSIDMGPDYQVLFLSMLLFNYTSQCSSVFIYIYRYEFS